MDIANHPIMRRFVQNPEDQRSMAPVLGLTSLSLLLIPALAPYSWGPAVTTALVGGSALVALARTGARSTVRRVAEVIVGFTTLMAAAAPLLDADSTDRLIQIVGVGLLTLLLMITPIVVLFRLLIRPRVTVDTLLGALAAYLQIGLFFGALYRFVSLVENVPFFAEQSTASVLEFQYFSFITMTTVGYGDLTPASDYARMLSVVEAVLGQVFLVTVVALTVANLGRETPRHRQATSDAQLSAGDDQAGDDQADDK